MNIMESVSYPIGFTSDWQVDRERVYFNERLKKAQARERRLIKAGYTQSPRVRIEEYGVIRYEIRCWRHEPSCKAYADAVLDAITAGRITLS